MCGESQSNTTSYSNTSYDPWVQGAGKDIFNTAATGVQNKPYQAYTGPTSAAFGDSWNSSKDYLSSLLGQINPTTNTATSDLAKFMSSIDPSKSLASYMNPYTDAVTNPQIAKVNEAAGIQNQALGAQAANAGAYGDSSLGVQRAIGARDTQRNIADIVGKGQADAYNSAVSQKQDDLAKYLSGITQGGVLGQNAATQQTNIAQLLAALGTQQQQAGQTGIQNAMQLNKDNQMGGLTQLTSLAALLGALPLNKTQIGNSTTTSPDNSGMALAGSLLSAFI